MNRSKYLADYKIAKLQYIDCINILKKSSVLDMKRQQLNVTCSITSEQHTLTYVIIYTMMRFLTKICTCRFYPFLGWNFSQLQFFVKKSKTYILFYTTHFSLSPTFDMDFSCKDSSQSACSDSLPGRIALIFSASVRILNVHFASNS